ncbi:DENN domain-containing protein 2A isoform X1 [Talpa occidentalis]|uniref:DENN domain-containing protein 2A isoform X1 n=2 Tax=Talpa occidentalis TaxID=50954 RepID=UPI00189068E4|nr:DENN domain-containing protein 2A isoform X1 [Talpa occidentalis]XP_037370357.1 DENN domain-containing protein 2A isoform X1 [Talpa occidentalis]XP_037370378.1 DENN domain-containing protein 2A isoform X1 [Talpa occidentalis]XP_054548707.1 DENN domain-containing protein 2A isoform X1 [Talpa occidentalis]
MMTVCRPAQGSHSQTANLSYNLADKVKVKGTGAGEDPRRQPFKSSIPFREADQDSPSRRSPIESLHSLMLEPRVDCFSKNMFSSNMIISDPASELSAKEASRAGRKQLGGLPNPCPPARGGARHKSLSIKDKISEWEGKKEWPAPAAGRKVDGPEAYLPACVMERRRSDGGRTRVAEAQNGSRPETESPEKERNKGVLRVGGQDAERRQDLSQPDRELASSMAGCPRLGKQRLQHDSLSVQKQVKKLEQALKDGSAGLDPQLPGTCYSPHCLPDKTEEGPSLFETRGAGSGSEFRSHPWDLEARAPAQEAVEERKGWCWRPSDQGPDGVCRGSEGNPPKPFINPLPKPRRTFKHDGEGDKDGNPGMRFRKEKRNLPPLPSLPPPPLPSSPPPSSVNRRLWNGRPKPSADHRKSYEFEDLLQSSSESGRVDWYAQTKLGLTRTLSEENVYEDILDPPMKENPYEDIELHGRCLGKKCVLNFPSSPTSSIPDTSTKQSLSKPAFFRQNSERRNFKLLDTRKLSRDGTGSPSKTSPPSTPSSPDDTFFNLGDPQNGRKKRKIPKLVVRINAIYEARRGKKRVKRLSQSTESNSGKVTDENSESDSDTEEKLKAHSQRLVNVKSRLKQAPRYPSLDRELVEYQERQLFEYFVVVSLHKKQAGAAYVPELTQQFPLKLERSFKFMREAEDQLKAIPQFCFPDAKDWTPVQQFTSETFSFVLTGEDGSRRFGYCRRLLPGGKGKRLPEVYCIVSRLGCFSLFSKILDEVEKRRGISPALVQPLMRSVMEAPFPALGKTIMVKNFLPGSGTEVIELCRPLDSRLEHVDFESLFSSLSIRHLLCVFASLLLERRVIFIADKLSTLSKCCHAMVAVIYPFAWQHTYIPVLPPAMIDIVCSPTPFLIGLLTSSLPLLRELPLEEVLVVDLVNNRFLRQMDDEDSILPRKLQVALEHILEQRNDLASDQDEGPLDCKHGPESSPLNEVVSEAFVRFFVEIVGHYSLFLTAGEREERTLQREAFRKAVSSKSLRRFLEVFMETQTFRGFIQERELRRQDVKGLFEVRAQEYLETLPSGEHSGVNKFLKGLGNKMKFLHKK